MGPPDFGNRSGGLWGGSWSGPTRSAFARPTGTVPAEAGPRAPLATGPPRIQEAGQESIHFPPQFLLTDSIRDPNRIPTSFTRLGAGGSEPIANPQTKKLYWWERFCSYRLASHIKIPIRIKNAISGHISPVDKTQAMAKAKRIANIISGWGPRCTALAKRIKNSIHNTKHIFSPSGNRPASEAPPVQRGGTKGTCFGLPPGGPMP